MKKIPKENIYGKDERAITNTAVARRLIRLIGLAVSPHDPFIWTLQGQLKKATKSGCVFSYEEHSRLRVTRHAIYSLQAIRKE